MKCFMIYPYDFEDSVYGNIHSCIGIRDFNSKKNLLVYLQMNICSEDTRKPFNFKTLLKYAKECKIFCFAKKYREAIVNKFNIIEDE